MFSLLPKPLTDSDIHIWSASLSIPAQDLSLYASLLSPDEVKRAQRFYFDKDRGHYIAGRGILRTLLGKYLNLAPDQIEFEYGTHGKPLLKSSLRKTKLEFNVSHSHGAALYAFTLNCNIGVDLERRIFLENMDDFAERFFTPNEIEMVRSSSSGEKKKDLFFKLWTCKEAYLKANGSGLHLPLNQVEVQFEVDRAVRLLSVDGKPIHWWIHSFIQRPEYQCAVCVEGGEKEIVFLTL